MAKKKEEKEEKKGTTVNTVGELKNQIKKSKEALFEITLDQEQRKLKNTSQLSHKRKEIARLLTALRILELAQ